MTEAATILSVRFECLSAKTITTNEVELPPVSSVQQIKEYFEEKYDIPVCLQTLRRSSVVLKQDTPVASLRLRDGDELHVSYYAKAECQEMRKAMRWLEVFVNCVVQDSDEFQQDEEEVLEDMVNCLFSPWETPVTLANKKVFVSNGGLNLTIQLHNYLLSHQWEKLPGPLKLMEGQVLHVLWSLSEDITFRQVIFNKGGLKNCKMSLLRVPILPNQPIIDKSTPDDNSVLLLTVQRAIAFLTGMLDVPFSHMELATDASAMRQLSNVMHCPSINEETMVDIVNLWKNLAYTAETHSYLVEAGLVESFLAKPNIEEFENCNDLMLLYQYHGAAFLAQIVLVSLSLFAEKEKDINSFLTNFVQETHPLETTKIDYFFESTLLPYIKLVYQPDNSPFCGTRSVALHTIIIALHIMLGKEFHRDVLIREGLMDYITCMPWYTTGAAEQRPRALVRMVQQAPDVDLQPPSLLNIAKAFMSKNGLQTVVHLSVPEILQIVHY